MKHKIQLVLSIMLVLLVSACAGKQNADTNVAVAVAVALTQTAAAPAIMPPAATPDSAVPMAQTQAASTPASLPEVTATQANSQTQAAGADRIVFQPNTTYWYTNYDLAANATVRSVLAAKKGQQMTIRLNTEPVSDASNIYAGLYITGADGTVFTTSPETYWSAVLPASQDYYIEVRSLTKQDITFEISVEIPTAVIDPALGTMYDLIPETRCQEFQTTAAQALGVDFSLQTRAPFLDTIAGEAGQGCHLGAHGNGKQFSSPGAVVTALTNSVGRDWTLQPEYQADGPTGSATALTRDMGLMLISVNWQPEMGVTCPADQPISACNLTPEQKNYIIEINIAQYKADFSLDGHWEDATTGLSLDLNQDWKNIYGHHTIVAQGGNKIDTLDVSINGKLQGKVATVQFQSAFSKDTGTAQITYIDVNTIQWKIINPPSGEYYLPAEATLTRK
jgi:hypothetical protein